jgi:hypothetical protein
MGDVIDMPDMEPAPVINKFDQIEQRINDIYAALIK